ncbi:Nn.00g075740.m01.CDS01 [Neocucurbitaria sp. VM-36]
MGDTVDNSLRPASSFFERLPYDVRAIIYSHLEPGQLPPITSGFQQENCGFILSCHRAKEELEEVPRIKFTNYLVEFGTTFEKSTSLTIHIPSISTPIIPTTLTQLRHVTITLPFTSLDRHRPSIRNHVWKREVLVGLHPLFALFLDQLHIHFSGHDNMPACASLLDRGKVEVNMHSLLRDVTYMIERVNKDKTGGTNVVVETIFKYEAGQRRQAYPSARVNAKRICLSWNLTEGEQQRGDLEIHMNGRLHRHSASEFEVHGGNRNAEMFYHLRDKRLLVGEMGIISDSRWEMTEHTKVISLLNGVETRWVYCSCGDLGDDLREGLDGMSEAAFEEGEEDLSRLIYC